jgi:hypothetical protein
MKLNFDYIYAIPCFYFKKDMLGEEVDVFISCWTANSENEPVYYPRDHKTTIEHFYDGVDELNEIKKNRSWAV